MTRGILVFSVVSACVLAVSAAMASNPGFDPEEIYGMDHCYDCESDNGCANCPAPSPCTPNGDDCKEVRWLTPTNDMKCAAKESGGTFDECSNPFAGACTQEFLGFCPEEPQCPTPGLPCGAKKDCNGTGTCEHAAQ